MTDAGSITIAMIFFSNFFSSQFFVGIKKKLLGGKNKLVVKKDFLSGPTKSFLGGVKQPFFFLFVGCQKKMERAKKMFFLGRGW